jgi:DNA-binding transcriptional ArsR family regulator
LGLVVTLAAPALAQSEPAHIEVPVEAGGLSIEASESAALLEGGNASLAASAASGSLEVWQERTRCVEQDESTCFDEQAETSRNTYSLTDASLTLAPREDAEHKTLVGLEPDGRAVVDLPEASIGATEAREVTFEDSAGPPEDVGTAQMPAGALSEARGGDLLMEGQLVVHTTGSTVTVDANDTEGPQRIVTGESWESGDDGFAYRTVRVVKANLAGGLTAAWDDALTTATTLPTSLTADVAEVNVTKGQLGGADNETPRTQLADLEASITGIEWPDSETQTSPEFQDPDSDESPPPRFVVEQGQAPTPAPEQPEESSVSRTTVIGAGSAAAAAALLAAYYWPRLSWVATTLVLPLYSRIEKDELFENDTREELYEEIKDDPGIHAHALSEAVDIGWGTTVYHLRRLERNGFVNSEKRGRYRRFFPASGFVERQREALSVLQNETTEAIAELVREQPGLNQSAICEELDISPSLANWHLNRLIDAELVDRERRGRTVHYTPGEAWEALEQAAELGAPEAPSDAQPA